MKKIFFILSALFLLNINGIAQDSQVSYTNGNYAMMSGDYERALYQFYNAYRSNNAFKNDDKILITAFIAQTLNKLGSYSKSNEWIDKTLNHEETNKKSRSMVEPIKADNDSRMNQDNKIDYLSSEREKDYYNNVDAEDLIYKGKGLYQQQQYIDAMVKFENADKLLTRHKKEHALFYYMYADSYNKSGLLKTEKYEGYIKMLEKSVELNPSLDIMVYATLSDAYATVGDYEKSVKALDDIKVNFTLNDKVREILAQIRDERSTQLNQINAGKELKKKPIEVKITNLGPNLNTKYADYFPSITADESIFLFTSRREGSTGGLVKDLYDEDLWYSEKQADGTWGPAKNFGKPVNTPNNNGIASFTGDGQYVVCGRCNETDSYGSCDVYGVTLNGRDWGNPVNLGANINSKAWDAQACISTDGKILIWSSEREGGKGASDLWISYKDTLGNWSYAKNLGSTINTTGYEYSPYLHPDGKTLYFSSNYLSPRIGGWDIYKTVLQEDGSWSKPENLGYPLNTEADELYFVLSASGVKGYFASKRADGYGEDDLYEVKFPESERSALVTVVGFVTDDETKQPIAGTVAIEDLETKKLIGTYNTNVATGKFVVVLTPGRNYSLTVNKNGYLFYSENFNIGAENEFKEVKKDIALKKIKSGNKIVLNNIFFDTGKSTLRKESDAELDKLAKLLNENPAITVEISGHTDNVGDDKSNNALSNDRAAVVVDALVKKGIDAKRLIGKGYGKTQPIAPNDTEEGRQMNRRTEFKVL